MFAMAGMALTAAGCASPGKLAKAEFGYPKSKVDAPGLFVENCARCHGQDGQAKTFHGRILGAQNLADAHWRSETPGVEIVQAIQTGPGAMPAFARKLSRPEIEALAAYVQTFPAATQ